MNMQSTRVSALVASPASFLIGVLLLIAASAVVTDAQRDPVIGTWKLSLAKSTYNPGPPPKNTTRTYEAVGARIRVTVRGVDGFDNPVNYTYTAGYDGKDVRVTGMGVPGAADSIALSRTDAFTVHETLKQSGKVVFNATRVVSKDGKVLTFVAEGVNVSGKPTANVGVYDRQ